MDLATYAAEAAVEANHWWFVGRRHLFARLIAELGLPPDAAILDVGTSTGTNLRMLRGIGFKRVVGIDASPEALGYCMEKGLGELCLGDVCALPFPEASFDLVLATDIIEHVDDDSRALQELCRVLRPGGRLLLTVPAFQILWGLQDEVAHHRRRYRMSHLLARVRSANLTPRETFHFNYLLFLPILLMRQGMRLLNIRLDSENQLNPTWLNVVLDPLFRFDVWSARWIRPPVGVSALVLAMRAPK